MFSKHQNYLLVFVKIGICKKLLHIMGTTKMFESSCHIKQSRGMGGGAK